MRKLYAYIVAVVTLLVLSIVSMPTIVNEMQTGIEFKGGFDDDINELSQHHNHYERRYWYPERRKRYNDWI